MATEVTKAVRSVSQYGITKHGVDNDQYFPGDGIAFTQYTDFATGIGDCAREALDDALEQLASSGWDVSPIVEHELAGMSTRSLCADCEHYNAQEGCLVPGEECELHWYVTVKVRE